MAGLDKSTVEEVVSLVQKPGRYTGCELNSIIKEKARIRMALSYPDLYEVGMSNNGLRILYDIVNKIPDVACERVFAVDADFEQALRSNNVPLYTLETYTPLNMLDILGFNVSHELLCTNLLQILDLGGVPVLSAERRESDPIVIAGGEAVSNPFPLSDFIDLFFIGDGEDGIVEIVTLVLSGKEQNLTRSGIMDRMASVEGVLIPGRYRMSYDGSGAAVLKGPPVRKRIYRGRALADPVKPIVPNIRITQERAVIEVTRGCVNFCNFCHAGYYDLPYRYYDHRAIAERIFEIVRNTGYNEVTLSSLSISDYPYLTDLINAVIPDLTEKGISVSFPSLRVDAATLPLIERISEVRRASLTFAVESASEQIRARANKNIFIQDLLDIVRRVFQLGWKVIKLYFMIGLPGCEQYDEAADIIFLLKEIYRIGGSGLVINVTVSPFVPKPHTPFEQERQMDAGYFENTVRRIKQNLPRVITIKSHNAGSSLLEGVLARGDVRLGDVIQRSYQDGCRFDSWNEHFRFDIWKANLDRAIPGWERFLAPGREETFPWSAITTGFERLVKSQKDKCTAATQTRARLRLKRHEFDALPIEEARDKFALRFSVKKRIRIRLAKTGLMRFIPHNDFMEIVKRGLRMAEAPVAMSQGFNKRERISMGYPLPLGIESEAELVDIELFDCIGGDFKDRLIPSLPSGIDVVDVHYIDRRVSLMEITGIIEYRISSATGELCPVICERLTAEPDFTKKTKKAVRTIPFNAAVCSHRFLDNTSLLLRLYAGSVDSVRIDDVLETLVGKACNEVRGMRILKIAQYRNVEGRSELII